MTRGADGVFGDEQGDGEPAEGEAAEPTGLQLGADGSEDVGGGLGQLPTVPQHQRGAGGGMREIGLGGLGGLVARDAAAQREEPRPAHRALYSLRINSCSDAN
ncbi:hypothetical protein ABT040_37825 [Streptomyces sp. NPDC002688]|uniref:hypothetical protein n=1 Tax=Streptomyces sp. NPDC002688 TaxID=3154423 RepID=UPI00333392D6